jgi:hypothetical protein
MGDIDPAEAGGVVLDLTGGLRRSTMITTAPMIATATTAPTTQGHHEAGLDELEEGEGIVVQFTPLQDPAPVKFVPIQEYVSLSPGGLYEAKTSSEKAEAGPAAAVATLNEIVEWVTE